MFERYTEKSRRVIFFARYEASNFGSVQIETEHLLLGLLREDKSLANRYLNSPLSLESIRKQVEDRSTRGEKISTSVDLPMSAGCKRVLAFGAEESNRLGHLHVGTAHLLGGLLREESGLAAEILRESGLQLSQVREDLKQGPAHDPSEAKSASQEALEAKITASLAELQTKILARTVPPPLLDLPAETIAELTRQAQGRGLDAKAHLLALLHTALHPHETPPGTTAAESSRRETYRTLRGRIEAEGLPYLDQAALDEEVARRKGKQS